MLGELIAALAATVTITPEESYLQASFALDEAVERYEFAPYDTPQRKDAWHVLSDEWIFNGQMLRRADGETFSSFTLNISPDSKLHDRRYVAASKVGDGWALYLAAFGDVYGKSTLRFEGFDGDVVLRAPGAEGGLQDGFEVDGNTLRIAYIGPEDHVAEGPTSLIAGPELPDWVGEALVSDAARVADVLERRLGKPAAATPVIIASFEPTGDGRTYKGGTLDGATIKVDLVGDYTDFDEERARDMAKFTAHEMVHLWINEVWDTTENSVAPWLHEGAAEYIAVRMTHNRDQFRDVVERNLQRCIEGLNGRALADKTNPIYGSVPYDCGFTVQLIAELASLKRRRGDILDIWKRVVEAAPGGFYDNALFLRVASRLGGKRFDEASGPLLNAHGAMKAFALGAPLGALGIDWEIGPPGARDGDLLMRPALYDIIRSDCQGNISVYTEQDRFRLVPLEQCGPVFAAGPSIVAVNGVSMFDDAFGAYTVMRDICAAKGGLVFSTPEGEALAPVQCSAKISSPLGVMRLAPLPELPALDR